MTNYLERATQFINMADATGEVALGWGLHLQTRADLIAAQANWEDGDVSKNADYTTAPYWLQTDDGATPEAIHNAQDLADLFAKIEF